MKTALHPSTRFRFAVSALGLAAAASSLAFGPAKAKGQLSTSDVTVKATAFSDRIVLTTLSDRTGTRNWATPTADGTRLVSFAIVDGRTIPLRWRFQAVRESKPNRTLTFTFACSSPKLLAKSEWSAAKTSGAIEETLSIINRSGKAVTLPLQHSLAWTFQRIPGHALESWWIEKAAGGASATGVHANPVGADFHQTVMSEPYVSDQRAYSQNWKDRDAIPWVSVRDKKTNSGWYAGIEFSGRVSLDLQPNGKNAIGAELGIAAEPKGSPEFRTIVQPGETYALPTVFVGCFKGEVEDGCNQMKHWVDSALRPKAADSRYPLLTLNSWGSGMGIDEKLAYDMSHQAADLGIEQFHIDAGWFRGVGDWRPNPAKFPHGLAIVANQVHALGLKFGLWVGWTQGGIDPDAEDRQMVLNVHAPDRISWFAQNYAADWKPADFVGADLCLSDPHATKWCIDLLTRVVKDYHLDMLEHDQRMIVADCVQTGHPHTASHGDIAYRAALGYYKVYDAIRKEYPNLLFEDCVNGGRMVDYGAAKRVHYFSIVDSYAPLANREAIYDVTYVIPPAMCECYVCAVPWKNIGEFRYMLRSGLMGWCSIMQDPDTWTPEQHAVAKREFAIYKTKLRPLIRNGDLYHVSERPDGVRWDGMQYVSRDKKDGVLYAFRGTTGEAQHTFVLKGLDPKKRYRVHFEDPGQSDQTVLGADLMSRGVVVMLADPNASQLVFTTAETP